MILRYLKRFVGIVLALALTVAVCIAVFGRDLMHIATGSVSHALCAATFISGFDPDQVYREQELPENGMHWIDWALHYDIDRVRQEVRTTVVGAFGARAVFRQGLGCVLVHGNDEIPRVDAEVREPVAASAFAGPNVVEPTDPALRKALDFAFAEPDPVHLRWTKAVVVLHDGRLIAERYAPGYGPDTSIWAHSLSKSLTSALIGILVNQGKLRREQPAPIAAWGDPADPHHAITVDQLVRMTSGLPFDETNSPVNPATRMWFLERDMAGYAEHEPLAHPPGTAWGYSNLGYLILSRIVRDAAGGGIVDAERFARRELFEPLGMRTMTIDHDITGTPLGASHTYGSARDWARFGQLYLDDGVADGRRILPEGWASYSASQSLDTGYGAGFWTNLVNEGSVPIWNAPWGMPRLPKDMFFARGYLGQYIVIVPSERLVVARFGLTHDGSTGIGGAVADIITALHGQPAQP
ncbi:serine hydrolase [Dokdonella soli]|uniref:Serine hydrolase n=1 Tax=Dokdonella soli TaxID=529810 RepID=A0ABP3U0I2_9GAMM